ncbi:MAG TPA: hypothetical protein ENO23_04110 [Alphaproteobacteria bacterium]|nr:hypothetical protein [Alphaproteobacteria bacterium]
MSVQLKHLAGLGAEYRDPIAAIDWGAADDTRPWLPPALLSLSGLAAQDRMTREELLRFSRVEFARLCAAGLWLEGLLISRIMRNGCLTTMPDEARVMLQEVREEAGHSLMFVEMIDRAGLGGVPLLGDIRLLTRVAHRLTPDQPEFWAMVFIGESVTDTLALKALRDQGGICPVARRVLHLHHHDEARHMAAAKTLLQTRLGGMPGARRRLFEIALGFLLRRFLKATLYPTERSLAAMGLPDPAGAARAAAASPERARLSAECAAPALRFVGRTLRSRGEAAPEVRP